MMMMSLLRNFHYQSTIELTVVNLIDSFTHTTMKKTHHEYMKKSKFKSIHNTKRDIINGVKLITKIIFDFAHRIVRCVMCWLVQLKIEFFKFFIHYYYRKLNKIFINFKNSKIYIINQSNH
jgi:hypothetical protein